MPAGLSDNDLAKRIRAAVASGEFSKAKLLWAEYGQQFRADLRFGPVPQSRLTEARELAEWTRVTALCARTRARNRLSQIAVARRYEAVEERTESRMAVRG